MQPGVEPLDDLLHHDQAAPTARRTRGPVGKKPRRSKPKNRRTRPSDPMAAQGLPHRYTDEGIRERTEQLRAEGRLSDVRVEVRDGLERQIEHRLAAADGKIEPWSSPDPLKEADLKVPARPGMKRRLLSSRVEKRRGTRGWIPVVQKNGDLVKVGDMYLGEMPTESADKRNRHYQEIGNSMVRDMEDRTTEDMNKIIRDAKKHGMTVLKPGEVVQDFRDTSNSAAVGLDIRRGT